MKLNKLTPEEEKIIIHKGTEPPFSGEYDKFFKEGVYVCRRCDTPLYESKSKFDSGCGWPSFDREIPGRVKRILDADGTRTEIVCVACGAHLGHVFEGEKLTPRNTRYCVNSLSLKFTPLEIQKQSHKSESSQAKWLRRNINPDSNNNPKFLTGFIPAAPKGKTETVVFGGGCFWCTEAVFSRLKGVINVTPGYAGGSAVNPTYEAVASGATGHAEVIKIEYDPGIISFENLLEVFFAVHNPTTPNRQGNDVGTQYRSIILYQNDRQKKIAEEFIIKLSDEKVLAKPIVTEIKPLGVFYKAEDCHGHYYDENSANPYCQLVISPKLAKLRKKFSRLLKQ